MPLTKIEGPSLGNVTISSITSNASFDSGTLFVDAANNVVGIGNTTPIHKLRVEGTTSVSGNVSIDANLVVTGNLTVSGTTVTVNSENVLIKDNLITLSSNVTGAPVLDAGIEVNRGTSANVILKWNETSDLWQLTNDGTNYGNILTTLSSTGVNADALSTGTVPLARLTSANTSANGVVDTTTQTFAGNKTFQNTASFSNTVSITGAANALSTFGVGGTLSALGQLSVTGNATFDTNTLFVDAANNYVGIGNAVPTHKLTVDISSTSGVVGSMANAYPVVQFGNQSSDATRRALEIGVVGGSVTAPVYLKVVGTGNRFAIFNQSNTEQFTIDSSGNIGIGVTPSYRLDITGSAGSVVARFNQATAGKTGVFFAENGTQRAFLSQVGLYSGTSDGNFGIFVETGYNFQIATNGSVTSKFTVHTGGDVAIGATAKFLLDGVAGTGDSYLSEAGANVIRVTVGGVSAVQWDTTGMYLNTAPPTSASAANAVVGSGSDYLRRSTSSLLYKHDIATLDTTDALSAVMAMRPVTYRGKTDEDQRRFVGFIAEEVQEIAPLLCTYDEGGESGTPNYVTYDRVTAYLVAVVQQQQNEINALKARLATLEA